MERKNVCVVMICPSRHTEEARAYAREQLAPAGFKVDNEMVIDFSDVFPGNDDDKVASTVKLIESLRSSGHPVLGEDRFWGIMGVGGDFFSANEDGVRKHLLVIAILRGGEGPGDDPLAIDWCFDK